MGRFVRVAARSEIPESGGRSVEVEGRRIALFAVGDRVYAIDDECPHAGAQLSEGIVEGEVVECPWHASRFHLRTGEVLEPPADEGVTAYFVRVQGEDVEIEL